MQNQTGWWGARRVLKHYGKEMFYLTFMRIR